jgi:hypothetical protein
VLNAIIGQCATPCFPIFSLLEEKFLSQKPFQVRHPVIFFSESYNGKMAKTQGKRTQLLMERETQSSC